MNVPNQPLGHGWMSHEDLRARGPQCLPSDHAPLSPQSSVASSGSGGSEHLEDQTTARNTFQEEGSGMKGEWRPLATESIPLFGIRRVRREVGSEEEGARPSPGWWSWLWRKGLGFPFQGFLPKPGKSKRGQHPLFFFECSDLQTIKCVTAGGDSIYCLHVRSWSALFVKTLSCSSLLPHCFGQGTVNNLAKQTAGSFFKSLSVYNCSVAFFPLSLFLWYPKKLANPFSLHLFKGHEKNTTETLWQCFKPDSRFAYRW